MTLMVCSKIPSELQVFFVSSHAVPGNVRRHLARPINAIVNTLVNLIVCIEDYINKKNLLKNKFNCLGW